MCSICGMIDFEDKSNLDVKALEDMSLTMKKRGPDDSGIISGGFYAFAHNRLSVMDIENGKQPMTVCFEGNYYTIIGCRTTLISIIWFL